MKIWKYHASLGDLRFVEMPKGSRILTVQMQGLSLCLWALVDPTEKEREVHTIATFGTGHDLPKNPGQYLATVQPTPDLAFHIFELPVEAPEEAPRDR